MPKIDLIQGDCLEKMKDIPDGSIDMILCDLPYGTTQCKWDTVIPFEPLWLQYKRVCKGAIVLTGSEPFSSLLRVSNLDMFKYDWIWEKSKGCNFVHAKNMPIKFHETISIFSKEKIGHEIQLKNNRMNYYPQDLIKVDKKWSRPKKYESEHKMKRESHSLNRIIEFENYPKSIIKINNSNNNERGNHESQKPVTLLEYLIKTYTLENETVLDNCMGSGSTGVACVNTNRNFIGIEKDDKYFEVARKRIDEAIEDKKQMLF